MSADDLYHSSLLSHSANNTTLQEAAMRDAANPRDLRAKKVVRRTLPKLKADLVPKLKQDTLWHY